MGGKYRGQASSSDYAPAVSQIRFDDDGSTNWYFGANTSGGVDFSGASTSLNNSNFDFVSSVRHELLHCLGIVTGNPIYTALTSGSSFVGSNARGANRDNSVPLSGSGAGHIAFSLPSVMNPSTDTGVRRDLTGVEWGMLKDLGWDVVDPPGFVRKFDLLTSGAEGSVSLRVVPSRGVYIMRLDALNGDVITLSTRDGTVGSEQGVDTYLKLFNSDGDVVASNDDTSTSIKSYIRYTAARGGTYYVGASTYSQRNYTLTTPSTTTPASTAFYFDAEIGSRGDREPDNIAGATTPFTLGSTVTTNLNDVGDNDYYRIDAVAGRTYTVTTSLPTGGGLPGAAIITIYDASGRKVAGMSEPNSDSGSYYGTVSFRAPASGPYYVVVKHYVGADQVGVNDGQIQVGWGFYSPADNYGGSGDHDSASDYALKITERAPAPGEPGGGSSGDFVAPVVVGVDQVVRRKKGRKIVSITIRFSGDVAAASASNPALFALALRVRKKGKLRYAKRVPIARTAHGASRNLVAITLARPVKGPLQLTVLPGVLGVGGAASTAKFVQIVR